MQLVKYRFFSSFFFIINALFIAISCKHKKYTIYLTERRGGITMATNEDGERDK